MMRIYRFGASLWAVGMVALGGCAVQEKKDLAAAQTNARRELRKCPGRPARAQLREGDDRIKDW